MLIIKLFCDLLVTWVLCFSDNHFITQMIYLVHKRNVVLDNDMIITINKKKVFFVWNRFSRVFLNPVS